LAILAWTLTSALAPGAADAASTGPTRIAFDRNGDIYTINPDGTGLVQLTATGQNANPSWSPDGTKIAFISRKYPNPGAELYTMNADGSGVSQISHDCPVAPCVEVQHKVSWSPDGARIAYSHGIVNQPTPGEDTFLDIFIINVDGTNETRLTHFGDGPTPDHFADYPDWSPDGTKITFMGVTAKIPTDQVYVINVDGTGLVRLTQPAAGRSFSFEPDWSPDGNEIAYDAFRTDGPDAFHTQLWIMTANGNNMRQVTSTPLGLSSYLSWAPDGRRIAVFAYYRVGKSNFVNPQLVKVDAATGGISRITPRSSPANQSDPDWSPVLTG